MPVTTARIQDNIYKAPHTANRRYKKHIHSKRISDCHFSILFILYYFCSDLGIGDVMAGTTLVTILKGAVFSLTQVSKRKVGSI